MNRKEQLRQKSELVLVHVNEQIGIDFNKYKEHDLAELIINMKNIILIQNYLIKSIYKPIIISLIIYIAMFFIIDMSLVGKIIYGIIGLVLFLFNGVIYGTLSFLSSIKKDLKSIINTSLNVTTNICQDIALVNVNIQEVKNPIGFIFEGVVAVAVTPTLNSIFIKVPFMSGLLNKSSDKVMDFVIAQFKNYEDKTNIKAFIGNGSEKIINKSNKLNDLISSFSEKTEGYINKTFSTFQTPFRIIFTVSMVFTLIFLLSFILF